MPLLTLPKKNNCPFNLVEAQVSVACLDKRCRYHRCLGQKYSVRELGPDNLCLAAYRAAYPYCLALLYDAAIPTEKGSVQVKCPNSHDYITMEISKKPALPPFLLGLKRGLEKIVATVYRPLDIPDSRITIKIIDQKGNCPYQYSIGQEFHFNIWGQKEICPAGFFQIYPFLTSYKESPVLISCPDDSGIVYQLGKTGGSETCPMNVTSTCSLNSKANFPQRLKTIPKDLCPLLTYSLYPYYLTLSNGGWFRWVKRGGEVMVNCPHPQGVVFGVFQKKAEGEVLAIVRKQKGACPKKYFPGEKFILSSEKY